MPKKPAPPRRPTIDPIEGANKIAAGKARANAALHHISEARRHLNAACADLCSVVGANGFWRALSRLANLVDVEKTHLGEAIIDDADPLYFDREPTEIDLIAPHRSGCGGCKPLTATGAGTLVLDADEARIVTLTADAMVDGAAYERFLDAGGLIHNNGYKLSIKARR